MTSRNSTRRFLGRDLSWGCGGVVIGIGVVVFVAIGSFINRINNISTSPAIIPSLPVQNPPIPTAASTLVPTFTKITPTELISPTEIESPAFLVNAEAALENGLAQQAIDLLLPELTNLTQTDVLARAYACLGEAEMQIGHFQFAAVYYGKLYNLQPQAEHLYWLAMSYDLGGDLRHALAEYEMLEQMTGDDAAFYRDIAEQRIADLRDVLYHTPSPPNPILGPTDTPVGTATP